MSLVGIEILKNDTRKVKINRFKNFRAEAELKMLMIKSNLQYING